jgi:hypothetical protein
VYGSDGTAYGNPQIAERAGVTNYTMTPPTQTPVQERQTMAETTPITPPTKGEQLIERLGEQVTGGDKTVPELGRVAPVQQELQQEEILTTPTSLAPVEVDASTALSNDLNVPTSTQQAASTYAATTVAPNTPEATAAQGKLSAESLIGDIQGSVSEQAQVTAQTEDVDQRATVQYQISELFKSIEEGKSLPAWAAPAVRSVNALMAQRGLGSSSMAASAITQAIYESAIPIAKLDADRYGTLQLQNLNNKQQAVLQNAMTFASMDKSNLDARLNAAVNNAKSFLSIDLQNLDNQQKINTVNFQGKLQALLTDAAAQNASSQFNAKSENQLNEFFTELDAQIQQSNANREAATRQFNVDQANAMKRYVQGLNDQREQFNANMQTQIDQSNAVWRRNLNTANTATQNEANRINALNLLNTSQSALNALWQRYRDEASWAFTATESAKQRDHQIALTAMEVSAQADLYEQKNEDDMYSALGGGVMAGIFSLLD